jgi:uncharacterized FlgJ-related protein
VTCKIYIGFFFEIVFRLFKEKNIPFIRKSISFVWKTNIPFFRNSISFIWKKKYYVYSKKKFFIINKKEYIDISFININPV